MADIVNTLAYELMRLEGIHGQNPETGAGIDSGESYIKQYTNRLFGSPFQLMDSVDRRFEEVNVHVGNEYLRNFILNSPILHIKPGMPIYTGGATGDAIQNSIKEMFLDVTSGNMTFVEALIEEAAKNTVFSSGSRLQKRMYGFRETYYQYMSHVNYMCRSMAIYLNLTEGTEFPNGAYCSGSNDQLVSFLGFKWENYRMLSDVVVMPPSEYASKLANATLLGTVNEILFDVGKDVVTGAASTAKEMAKTLNETYHGTGDDMFDSIIDATSLDTLEALGNGIINTAKNVAKDVAEDVVTYFTTTTTEILVDKVCQVLFMIEPGNFEETFTNRARESSIASTIDAVNSGIGQELAFITNSDTDLGLLDDVTKFLGNTVETAASYVAGLMKPVTGGFVSNLVNGAMASVKGQKMIYPKIYEGSEATRNYNFTVRLVSPYGDTYNYYMNIIVPLMHLIALVAPRMVTSNTVASPYLVQAFIPGMCTCNLGIVTNMTITKNPNSDRVSVHGFPLEVEVKFTIEELYNSLGISPSNDPAAFLFNETLNDYMANLGGLQPSVDTYTKQRATMLKSLNTYMEQKEWWEDVMNNRAMKLEVKYNRQIGR